MKAILIIIIKNTQSKGKKRRKKGIHTDKFPEITSTLSRSINSPGFLPLIPPCKRGVAMGEGVIVRLGSLSLKTRQVLAWSRSGIHFSTHLKIVDICCDPYLHPGLKIKNPIHLVMKAFYIKGTL
jgi:hypothetical protein